MWTIFCPVLVKSWTFLPNLLRVYVFTHIMDENIHLQKHACFCMISKGRFICSIEIIHSSPEWLTSQLMDHWNRMKLNMIPSQEPKGIIWIGGIVVHTPLTCVKIISSTKLGKSTKIWYLITNSMRNYEQINVSFATKYSTQLYTIPLSAVRI